MLMSKPLILNFVINTIVTFKNSNGDFADLALEMPFYGQWF